MSFSYRRLFCSSLSPKLSSRILRHSVHSQITQSVKPLRYRLFSSSSIPVNDPSPSVEEPKKVAEIECISVESDTTHSPAHRARVFKRKPKIRSISSVYPSSQWKVSCQTPFQIVGHNNVTIEDTEGSTLHQAIADMKVVAGFDEAGRGAVLGPLILALVLLPSKLTPTHIRDKHTTHSHKPAATAHTTQPIHKQHIPTSTLNTSPPSASTSLPSSSASSAAPLATATPFSTTSLVSSQHESHTESLDSYLLQLGVKDSKLLSPNRRSTLCKSIKKHCLLWRAVIIHADEIDARRSKDENLNQITLHGLLAMLQSIPHSAFQSTKDHTHDQIPIAFSPSVIMPKSPLSHLYVDSFDSVPSRLRTHLSRLLTLLPSQVTCESAADVKYVSVSASSIIAKVMRDLVLQQVIRDEEGETEVDKVGSGYSGDPKSRKWMKDKFDNGQEIARKLKRTSWKLKEGGGVDGAIEKEGGDA